LIESEALQIKLGDILKELKETVDVSLKIKAGDTKAEKTVTLLWEGFLREFIVYVQARGRKTGQNLLNGISLSKITR